jgi:glycosyltransferase involved in cell wall biosynthesis
MWTSWQTRCGIASYTGSLVEELRALGVEVDVVPVPYTDRSPATVEETLARLNRADLVHIQHEYTFFGGVAPRSCSLPLYFSRLKVPRVVTAHTVFTAAELLRLPQETRRRQWLAKRLLSLYPPYVRYVERMPFAGAAAVIVHTGAARERMLRRGLDPKRVHVLAAGIPRPSPAGGSPEEVAAARRRFGLEEGRIATIFGYVTPEKGYDVALDALAKLPAGIRLVVAGGPRVEREAGHLEALKEQIRSRGLSDRVTITGYLEEADVAAVMGLSDLVLVPHTVANGSYSVMIALAYGKPVLASDLDCFRDIHADGEPVELFRAGDAAALAERLSFLLVSPGSRRQLAGRAGEYAARRSWTEVARRTLDIYEGVIRDA